MRKYVNNIYSGIYTTLVGMVITFRQMFKQNVTHQYPYEHQFERKINVREIPTGYRGQLHNRVEDCIVCKKCAQICPVDCIHIDSHKPEKGVKLWESMNVVHLKDRSKLIGIVEGDTKKIVPDSTLIIHHTLPEGKSETISTNDINRIVGRRKVALYMDKFDIDMSLCMYCGLCTEVCPTESLTMFDSLRGIEYSSANRSELNYQFAKPEIY